MIVRIAVIGLELLFLLEIDIVDDDSETRDAGFRDIGDYRLEYIARSLADIDGKNQTVGDMTASIQSENVRSAIA